MKVTRSEKGTVQKKFPKKYFFTFLVQLLPISIYISVCSVVRPTEHTAKGKRQKEGCAVYRSKQQRVAGDLRSRTTDNYEASSDATFEVRLDLFMVIQIRQRAFQPER